MLFFSSVSGRDEADSRFGYVPTFTKRLHDVEAREGSKALFECRVMGIPEPEIAWYVLQCVVIHVVVVVVVVVVFYWWWLWW